MIAVLGLLGYASAIIVGIVLGWLAYVAGISAFFAVLKVADWVLP